MGIFYKIPLYCFGKGLHTRFLVVDTKQYRNPRALSFSNSFFARSSAGAPWGNNGIIDIKEQPSVSFSVKLLIIDPIRRIQIFIRKKASEHLFHLSPFLSLAKRNILCFRKDILICGTDDLIHIDKLFHTMCAPAYDTCNSKHRCKSSSGRSSML